METVYSVFSFKGRIGRLEWWGIALLITIIWSLYFAMFGLNYFKILFGVYFRTPEAMQGFTLALVSRPYLLTVGGPILFVLALWMNFAAMAKRYHDRDKSAWWIFIMFVPVIGTLWQLIECGFFAGTSGGNSYGSDPGHRSLNVDDVLGYDAEAAQTAATMVTRSARRDGASPSGVRPLAPAAFGRRGR